MSTRIVITEYADDRVIRQIDFEPMEPATLTWDTIYSDRNDFTQTRFISQPIHHLIMVKAKTKNGRIRTCPHTAADQLCACDWSIA